MKMNLIGILTSRGFAILLLILSIATLLLFKAFPDFYTSYILILPFFIFSSISFCLYKRISKRLKTSFSLSFIGSIIFHIGMLLVIASVSFGDYLRFNASIILPLNDSITTGDTIFTELHSLPAGQDMPYLTFKLLEQKTTYAEASIPVKHSAQIDIGMYEGDSYVRKKDTLSINAPLWRGGYQIMLVSGYVTPYVIIRDEEGEVVYSQYLKVASSVDREETFLLDDLGWTLNARYLPDFYVDDKGGFATLTMERKNEVVALRIQDHKNIFDDIWSGVLRIGDIVRADNFTVELADIKPVVVVQILKDPSYYGVFVGWLLAVLGLTLRYVPTYILDLKAQ